MFLSDFQQWPSVSCGAGERAEMEMLASGEQGGVKAAGDRKGPSFQLSRGAENPWEHIQQRQTASLLRHEADVRSHRRSGGALPGTRDSGPVYTW